jgi:hypothetical protein
MNESKPQAEENWENASREEILAALFANMVIQQTNMAMMLLGKVAHPETGKIVHDVEAAKMFIDQLEMLEAKTKGNLSKQEEGLLKQALAALHMAFVEAVDGPGSAGDAASEAPTERVTAPKPSPEQQPSRPPEAAAPKPAEPPAAASSEESRKKFSKKY